MLKSDTKWSWCWSRRRVEQCAKPISSFLHYKPPSPSPPPSLCSPTRGHLYQRKMSTIDPTPTPPPLPATTTTSISPAQSAALRLTTLEYLLHGHPSSSSLPSSSSNSAVLPRLSSAITQLSTLKQTCGKSLTRLIDEWETYSPLLHPLEPSQKEEVWDAKEQSSYLLTQYEDLTATLKDLTKIETLLEQAKVLDGDLNKGLARKHIFPPFLLVLMVVDTDERLWWCEQVQQQQTNKKG